VDSRYAMSQDPSLAAEPHLKSRKSSRIEGSSTNLEPEISGTISILKLRPETDLPYSDSFLILALILDPNPNSNHPTPLRTCRFPTKIQEKFFLGEGKSMPTTRFWTVVLCVLWYGLLIAAVSKELCHRFSKV